MGIMGSLKWNELFPTKMGAVVFVSYMALFINQGLLVRWSQNSLHGYNYNTKATVLLTEMVKLVMTFTLFTTSLHKVFEDKRTNSSNPRSASAYGFFQELRKHWIMFGYYLIPAVLYCLYNNLSYINLSKFDPTTYFLLLQFRVVVTGIVFQIIFNKKLSRLQWISLCLLTIGCMVKEMNLSTDQDPKTSSEKGIDVIGLFFIIVQVVSSSSAGVYNEFMFKSPKTASVNLLIQNTCLYLDSILCNIVAIYIFGEYFGLDDLMKILNNPIVLLLVFNNAAIGIVTSFFLSQLNSILKTFASALELMFTAVLCFILFGIPIGWNTVWAIGIVTGATFLYATSPVVNQKPTNTNVMEEELQKMVDEDV